MPYVWSPEAFDGVPTASRVLADSIEVGAVVICEDITQGQRVERVVVSGVSDGRERVPAGAISVGHQRIPRFPPSVVDEVKVRIEASRGPPAIRTLAVIDAGGAWPCR